MKKTLKCPVCGKGQMQEGGNGYYCDYIKSEEDNCRFQVFKSYSGVEITPRLLEQLIIKKTTEVLQFRNREGKKFFGKLKMIDHHHIIINFDENYLNSSCPICHNKLSATPNGFFCENTSCNFVIFAKIAGKDITIDMAENIISREDSFFQTDLINKEGNFFGAKIILNKSKELVFDFNLCNCTVCNNGKIRNNKNLYYCSNQDCEFKVFEQSNGALISPEDVIDMMKYKKSRIITFKRQDSTKYKGVYVVTDNGKLIIR